MLISNSKQSRESCNQSLRRKAAVGRIAENEGFKIRSQIGG